MTSQPPIKLSRLRDIGWAKWDPIGLLLPEETWEGQTFADEYDSYLLMIASHLRDGWTTDQAADYLVDIELNYMGLDERSSTVSRAHETARAIRAYLDEIDTKS